MRKITSGAVQSFNAKRNFKRANTEVEVTSTGSVVLYLHGHAIAEKLTDGRLFISACGWLSNTTKERLNGLDGVDIYQKDFQWYLNGCPWDGKNIEV